MLQSGVRPGPCPKGVCCLLGKRHLSDYNALLWVEESTKIIRTTEWVNEGQPWLLHPASRNMSGFPEILPAPGFGRSLNHLFLPFPGSLELWLLEGLLHVCSISVPAGLSEALPEPLEADPFLWWSWPFLHCSRRIGPPPTWSLMHYKSVCFLCITLPPQKDYPVQRAELCHLLP